MLVRLQPGGLVWYVENMLTMQVTEGFRCLSRTGASVLGESEAEKAYSPPPPSRFLVGSVTLVLGFLIGYMVGAPRW